VSARAHMRRMSEQRPTFLARKNPGCGWGVDILWPDGETEVVKGFITEHDAAKWIAEHSQANVLAARYRQGSSIREMGRELKAVRREKS
jgi:hypothetical protein